MKNMVEMPMEKSARRNGQIKFAWPPSMPHRRTASIKSRKCPCVYRILSRVSGHRCVGCAVESLQARARSHRAGLRSGKPSNKLLRQHVAVYGVDAFFFFFVCRRIHTARKACGDTNCNNLSCGGRSSWRPMTNAMVTTRRSVTSAPRLRGPGRRVNDQLILKWADDTND